MEAASGSISRLAAPRLWPIWCLIGLGWLIARLPLTLLFPLGKHLGRLAFRIGSARRSIANTNLRLCFPELPPGERRDLARRTFEAVTLGALELCIAWLNPKRDLRRRIEVQGAEHFRAAAAKGRGVLLLGAHFAVLDLISQALAEQGQIDVMYRKNRNPAWEWLQVRGRRRHFKGVIERRDARAALRALQAGRAVWYAADQDYGAKHSALPRGARYAYEYAAGLRRGDMYAGGFACRMVSRARWRYASLRALLMTRARPFSSVTMSSMRTPPHPGR